MALTVVSYALNGGGLGPVERLVAINRWLRRYAQTRRSGFEPFFLTSTEAENVVFAEKMAAFKIPSAAAAQESGLDQVRFAALAKQWIWHSLGLLQPDVLIVDTWPRGAYGELLSALDLCKKRVFIYPPVTREVTRAPDFQAMLPLYDLILIPAAKGDADVALDRVDPAKVRWVGPLMGRERVEFVDRQDARERLGAAPDTFLVYVSAGTSGSPQAEEQLLSICTALMDEPDLHLVVGAGPLYRGRLLQGPRITWLPHPSPGELMPALDAAVCTAEPTAFYELLSAGVPTAWIPQTLPGGETAARVKKAVDGGAAILIDPKDLRGATLLDAVAKLREEAVREAARRAAELAPPNGARDAAQAILSLLWSEADVARATGAMTDEVLQTLTALNVSNLHALLTLAGWLAPEERSLGGDATHAACKVIRVLRPHQLFPPHGYRLVEALCRVLPPGTPDARADAVVKLLDALACYEDWTATLTFVQSLTPQPEPTPDVFTEELTSLLSAAGDNGMSLQDLAEAMNAARLVQSFESQRATIAELTARLRETTGPGPS